MEAATIERIGAVAAGIVVAIVAFYALYKDWNTPGVENNVFKLMLLLLGIGGVIATLAGLGVLGTFKGA
jgi:hypothetical protein